MDWISANAIKAISVRRAVWRHTPDVDAAPLTVACLCAEWCGSCREYRPLFDRLGAGFAGRCRFVWIDIEDEADTVDGIDVENFPTLLIARDGIALFFGPLTPHLQTLQRLVEGALDGDLPARTVDPDVAALARRLA